VALTGIAAAPKTALQEMVLERLYTVFNFNMYNTSRHDGKLS